MRAGEAFVVVTYCRTATMNVFGEHFCRTKCDPRKSSIWMPFPFTYQAELSNPLTSTSMFPEKMARQVSTTMGKRPIEEIEPKHS